MSANDTQVGGDHYRDSEYQTWDFIWDMGLDYFQGNIIKYISRWKNKGGVKDLLKSEHYLEKYIEKGGGHKNREMVDKEDMVWIMHNQWAESNSFSDFERSFTLYVSWGGRDDLIRAQAILQFYLHEVESNDT